MSTPVPKCGTCKRNPKRMNSEVAECSHVDCPHRRPAWGNDTHESPAFRHESNRRVPAETQDE